MDAPRWRFGWLAAMPLLASCGGMIDYGEFPPETPPAAEPAPSATVIEDGIAREVALDQVAAVAQDALDEGTKVQVIIEDPPTGADLVPEGPPPAPGDSTNEEPPQSVDPTPAPVDEVLIIKLDGAKAKMLAGEIQIIIDGTVPDGQFTVIDTTVPRPDANTLGPPPADNTVLPPDDTTLQ